jgi:acyl-CoA thioesterase I
MLGLRSLTGAGYRPAPPGHLTQGRRRPLRKSWAFRAASTAPSVHTVEGMNRRRIALIAAPSAPAAPQRIVTIGDSIMAGFRLQPAQAWPALLGATDGIPVTNLGCSGGGFVAVGSCGSDFDGLIPQAVAAQPDLVIVQSSDNDEGVGAEKLAAATTRTLADLRAALPEARIVAFGTMWDKPRTAPAEIAASSGDLQAATDAVGGTFIDLGEPIAGQPALLQSDDEHPTVAGQQVLLQAIRTALDEAGIPL